MNKLLPFCVVILFFSIVNAHVGEKSYNNFSNSKVNRNLEIKANDLELLMGFSLSGPENQSFKIDNKNSKGEAVGRAYFLNKENSTEQLAWFWSPKSGFEIILNKDTFLNQSTEIQNYFSKKEYPYFQINSKISINEEAFIVGSVELYNFKGNLRERRYFWFYWSEEDGLNLSSLGADRISVQDIDNERNVLLLGKNGYSHEALLSNIYDMDEFKLIQYPIEEIKKCLSDCFWMYFNQAVKDGRMVSYHSKNKLECMWSWRCSAISCYVDSFLDDGRVHGVLRGKYCLRAKENIYFMYLENDIEVEFIIDDPVEIIIHSKYSNG